MPNPAIADDIVDRWRPLTAQETTNAQTFLNDAWGMLKRRFPELEAQMLEDADLQSEVVRILATAVLRVMKNPEGKRQESIDDYSWTRDEASSAGVLYFTADELDSITAGADGNGGAYSIDLIADYEARFL